MSNRKPDGGIDLSEERQQLAAAADLGHLRRETAEVAIIGLTAIERAYNLKREETEDMPGPKYDIVAVRKDGEEQTFTGYDGEERTSKFRKVGAVWERDGKLSLSFETAITDEDVADCWFNLFTREKGGNKGGGTKQAAAKKPAGKPPVKPGKKPVGPTKPATTKKEEPFEDDELDD